MTPCAPRCVALCSMFKVITTIYLSLHFLPCLMSPVFLSRGLSWPAPLSWPVTPQKNRLCQDHSPNQVFKVSFAIQGLFILQGSSALCKGRIYKVHVYMARFTTDAPFRSLRVALGLVVLVGIWIFFFFLIIYFLGWEEKGRASEDFAWSSIMALTYQPRDWCGAHTNHQVC